MTAEEVLRSNEETAIENNQFVFSGTGNRGKKSPIKFKKGFGAGIFITIIILVPIIFVGVGNLLPYGIISQINNFVNYQFSANGESVKTRLIAKALSNGSFAEYDTTIKYLKQSGVEVGYYNNGQFVEVGTTNTGQPLSLKSGDQIITADELPSAVMSNAKLMNAIDEATYGDAAYWYDESAQKMLSRNGVSRNVFKNNGDFKTEMNKEVGKGNNISVQSAEEVEVDVLDKNGNPVYNQDGSKQTTTEVKTDGTVTVTDAKTFIAKVGEESKASSTDKATIDAATTLSTSEIITKKEKSMKYAMGFLENIDKMRSGYGSESQINEAMNTLLETKESEVFDATKGATIKVTGSMVESPSFYSVLSGEKVKLEEVENYSNESIIRTMESKGFSDDENNSFTSTIASVGSKAKGLIGRIVSWFNDEADGEALQTVDSAVDMALINNSFDDTQGIAGGERMVYGLTMLGAENGKMSGGTKGDKAAVSAYQKLTDQVLALRAEADRMNRSPFDITSKNTFLGSIVYKFAISSVKSGTLLNKIASISKVTANAISGILPTAMADDNTGGGYLSTFGDCKRFSEIEGAVGSPTCADLVTFDTTRYDEIMDDNSSYYQWLSDKVTCDENNVCTIVKGSPLYEFAAYYLDKMTPDGVVDAGVLDSIKENKSISAVGSLMGAIKKIFSGEASEEEKRIASGAVFVNSSSNNDRENYINAQLYFSVVRETDNLRMYEGNPMAYADVPFVGIKNPVLACLEEIENERNTIASE